MDRHYIENRLRDTFNSLNKSDNLQPTSFDLEIGEFNIEVDITKKPIMVNCKFCGEPTIKDEPPCRWCEDGKLIASKHTKDKYNDLLGENDK